MNRISFNTLLKAHGHTIDQEIPEEIKTVVLRRLQMSL